jgi:MSHA biogenesis protein MshI
MGLFTKTNKTTGWMAVNLQEDGISAAYVKRLPGTMPVVEYVAFYPAEKSSLAQPLEKLSKDLHAARHHCTNLLAQGEYQLLSVDAPNVAQDELKTAIRWRLKDMLDFHVDDATIDVLDVPVEKDGPARTHSMYAVAARNQLIEQRQALFEKTKVPLSVIDIPEMAQRNISALLEPEGRGVALLSFDATGGLLTITFSGELYLARRLDVTLPQLMQADDTHANALHDRITLELQRSLDHFDRQYRHITLSKLVLSPLGDVGAGLKDYLATNLHLPIELLDLLSLLDISKAPVLKRLADQQRYFLTIGAALREEEVAL